MVTSFFEAIAWFIPLVGIILVIYFPATQNLNGEQNGERSRDYPQFKCSSNLKNAHGCGTKYGLDTCILLIWRVNHSIWQEIIEKVSGITPCHFGVSFTTAGAERLPLTQVGWQDWVSNCDVDVSTVDLSQIDTECLGKLLGYRFCSFGPGRALSLLEQSAFAGDTRIKCSGTILAYFWSLQVWFKMQYAGVSLSWVVWPWRFTWRIVSVQYVWILLAYFEPSTHGSLAFSAFLVLPATAVTTFGELLFLVAGGQSKPTSWQLFWRTGIRTHCLEVGAVYIHSYNIDVHVLI